MRNPSSAVIFNNFGTLAGFALLFLVSHLSAQVEECPKYCSPVNNNYGPACGSVAFSSDQKIYKTFSNICELFKQRCEDRQTGRSVIEFVNDGPCTSSFVRHHGFERQSDEMQTPEREPQRLEVSSDEVQRIYPRLPKKFKALPIERTPSFVQVQTNR